MTECASRQNRPSNQGLLNQVLATSPRSCVISGLLGFWVWRRLSEWAEVCSLTFLVISLRHQRRKGLGLSVHGVLGLSPACSGFVV